MEVYDNFLLILEAGMEGKPYYQRQVFFCMNERSDGDCCMSKKNRKSLAHAKNMVKELDLKGKGGVRVNQTDCLGRCDEGPVLVVYPDAVWYTYKNQDDVEEIIKSHLVDGKVVKRLKI
jgi:(2Fe-2S) ferredoxin